MDAHEQPQLGRWLLTTRKADGRKRQQRVTSGPSAAAYSNGFSTRTSKREKSRTLRVTTVRSCTSAVAAIMASS